ncbi:MAG: hypothetical protein HQL46_10495 [Gammaproteobacteria bacterium]|nr:hypothetical protein [Gammaproteobacteria bacterium]
MLNLTPIILATFLFLVLNSASAYERPSSGSYERNKCPESRIAQFQKLNNKLKKRSGKDHPGFIKKINYCKLFNKVKVSGKCDPAISSDKQKRSAERQLKDGGPYTYCIQDEVRLLLKK